MESALLFVTELAYEQLKARGAIFDLLSIGTRNLNAGTYPFVSGVHKPVIKHWLTMRMSNFCFDLKWV